MQLIQGATALSSFRLQRLSEALASNGLSKSLLDTRFWYFVKSDIPLDGASLAILAGILNGPAEPRPAEGPLLLVIPRLGTISPWATKATEIVRQCGFPQIERIERGIAYYCSGLDAAERNSVAALLHDRMTEAVISELDDAAALFAHYPPQPLQTVPVISQGIAALETANGAMGLALSSDEIDYLFSYFTALGRDPTNVELMMFAQANSEHCRHKIFNASWVVDGEPQPQSLFSMIRHTHACTPQGTVKAYSDNAAIIAGHAIQRLLRDDRGRYRYTPEQSDVLIKVETHNHPTAISPFAGAATGVGGEIRDEGATGRGGRPKAGLAGFSVSNLAIPGFEQPWEQTDGSVYGKPGRIASALQIMLEGPIGAAAFNNEFGRPNLAGYFRTYEQRVDGEMRGYHKPIMLAGGVGAIQRQQAEKKTLESGDLLVQIGGPAMLIGLGGGAASSMATGANAEQLDFDSVQRGNPEMQRRAQEVIDRCWQRGEANPIVSIHDVGAGGLSNALPELVHESQRGARFELRSIPNEEPGLSPMQLWCNEAQERYVLGIRAADWQAFEALCVRERCPVAVLGTVSDDEKLQLHDTHFDNFAIDMDLPVLLGKPPRMTRVAERKPAFSEVFPQQHIDLKEAVYRVLQLPAVADKSFLITIGDRTVGGLTARDQMVGPWQTPVADAAVTLADFVGYAGEAFSVGERAPFAVLDAPASGRMAIGEAITNLAAAPIAGLRDIKLSANWMAAAGHPGEDAALFDTVAAVALAFCPALGLSIPVGKDSLSMKTMWTDEGQAKSVTAPLSLIVSAFAPVGDVRQTLTPLLQIATPDTCLMLIDLGFGRNRLGGSALAQVYGAVGDETPDVNEPQRLAAFVDQITALKGNGLILAYHDRSDGGLIAAVSEMLFASHCGAELDLTALLGDETTHEAILKALFSEELGAVIQVRQSDSHRVAMAFVALGVAIHTIGTPNSTDRLSIRQGEAVLLDETRIDLQRAWAETSFKLQALRDNPACAQAQYDTLLDATDPGLCYQPTFTAAAPAITSVRPQVAILREQGVNGHLEMAAAFERAGFEPLDVHMSDILAGTFSLDAVQGLAACGGFSYGDVLGAGRGWANSILFNARARDEFSAFFARDDTFALGVCNGCQMMSHLAPIIPGAAGWPTFVRNRSEQFEARFSLLKIDASPSIFFDGMEGSLLPAVVSHGEGLTEFSRGSAAAIIAARYVDHGGAVTERYPFNPNGSTNGATAFTTPDGRFTIMMPHPERTFRAVQCSWLPEPLDEAGPWLHIFNNARKWMR